LNSECSQQNSANKRKHGAHSQHIQSQGMVHGRASLVEVARRYHESLGASKRVAAWQSVEFLVKESCAPDMARQLLDGSNERAQCEIKLHCAVVHNRRSGVICCANEARIFWIKMYANTIRANLHALPFVGKLKSAPTAA
jgi:hypothetical protein